MGMLLPLLFGILNVLTQKKSSAPLTPAIPTTTSPNVLAALRRQNTMLAGQKGRQSTLLTGGLLGSPASRKGLLAV